MHNDMDFLSNDSLVDVPDNFTNLVMQRIYSAPALPVRLPWLGKLQNLALVIAAILGFAQLATFIFSFWIATSAG